MKRELARNIRQGTMQVVYVIAWLVILSLLVWRSFPIYAASEVTTEFSKDRLEKVQVSNIVILQQNVSVQDQTVNGDLIIVGQNVKLSNIHVRGNIVIAAQNLVLSNVTVGSDAIILGHLVKVAELRSKLTTIIMAENINANGILSNNLKMYANRVKGVVRVVTLTVRATSVRLMGVAGKSYIYLPDKGMLDIDKLSTMEGAKVYYNGALKGFISESGAGFIGSMVTSRGMFSLKWFVLWVLNTILAAWVLIYILSPNTVLSIFNFSKRRHRWLSDSLFGFVFMVLFFIVTSVLVTAGALVGFGIQWLPLALFLFGIVVLLLIPAMIPVNTVYALLNSKIVKKASWGIRFKQLGIYSQVAIMSVILAVIIRLPLVGMIIYTWLYFATLGEFIRWLMHRAAGT